MIIRAIKILDEIPEKALFITNLGLSAFVMLAHGGALLVATSQGSDQLDMIQSLAMYSLPLAGIILISSIVALIWPKFRRTTLSVHALILCAGGFTMATWAVSLTVGEIPDGNFSWSSFFLTFLCTYPVYLFRCIVLRDKMESFFVKYVHVAVFLIVVVVDLGVLLKLMSTISERMIQMITIN